MAQQQLQKRQWKRWRKQQFKRKKRGAKACTSWFSFLSFGGFWMKHNNWLKWLEHLDLQHWILIASLQWIFLDLTSWDCNLWSCWNCTHGVDMLLQSQEHSLPPTGHLKAGDISDSNSSWIPWGVVVTPTHCQKGRWGEHISRSIMILYIPICNGRIQRIME